MSADNWAECPRCRDNWQAEQRERAQSVQAEYGKLDADQWLAKVGGLAATEQPDFETFREDYEFSGADIGALSIEYHGECTKCSLSCTYNKYIPFYP